MGETLSALRDQGKAILIFMSIAILSVLGIIILAEFKSSIDSGTTTAVNTTVDLFIAAIAVFGTFATITALIIAVKAIIGIVKGLK